MRAVLFGFEPFGDEPINPSGVAVQALHGRVVNGVRLHSVVLPVEYDRAFPSLRSVLDGEPVIAVMGVGQGKEHFQVETVARNVVGARPDNAGLADVRVVEEGAPAALRATWNANEIHAAVQRVQLGAPLILSEHAGDYLCNHTLYRVLRWCEDRVPAGFLHVPKLSVVTQDPITRAVEAAITALCNQRAAV